MSIHINPGSGPVPGTNIEHVLLNAVALADDIKRVFGVRVKIVPPVLNLNDGRWSFGLRVGKTAHAIQMPGLPLAQVRYVGTEDQNIWDFPRLYVDGESFVWKYAVENCGPEEEKA